MGGGLLGLGLVLALAVATAGDAITASDEPVNRWWFDLAKSSQGLADYAATFQVLGSGNVTAPVAVVFGLLLAGFRRWHWLAFFALSAAGGVAISELLKHAVGRPRPVWPDPFFIEEGFSFPSGHTLSGVTSWVAMGIVVMFVLTRPWGTILGWLLVVIGVGMGPSRWLYGVHWITDVLGGGSWGSAGCCWRPVSAFGGGVRHRLPKRADAWVRPRRSPPACASTRISGGGLAGQSSGGSSASRCSCSALPGPSMRCSDSDPRFPWAPSRLTP